MLPSPSRHSGDIDIEPQRTPSPFSLDKHRADVKPSLSSRRSRAVQTDRQEQVVPRDPSPRLPTLGVERDSLSTHGQESRSDSSSISQLQDIRSQSVVAAIIEKVTGFLVRMIQADVRTLTNRLKRQHLLPPGGDARHLSHSTISSIVNEVANLRPPGTGRDDATSNPSLLTVTRGDIKALLKLFKDTFTELGMLREQINEVIFDPSVAQKLRKEVIESDLVKGEQRSTSAMGGWIAPIQKLFTSQSAALPPALETSAASASTSKPSPEVGRGKAPPRMAPKLAPAISASSTTVKVEFSSSGVRKTDTSDGSLRDSSSSNISLKPPIHVTGHTALRRPIALPPPTSRSLMGIFAGAPQSVANPSLGAQKWEAPPNSDKNQARQIRGTASAVHLRQPSARNPSAATIGRSAMTPKSNRLSRNVDAVIDQKDNQVPDFHESLLERTLRPRGLSDSSIHTTFLKEMIDSAPEKHTEGNGDLFRGGAPTDISSSLSTAGSQPSSPPRIVARHYPIVERDSARSPVLRLGQHLASWATAATGRHYNDDVGLPEELLFDNLREDRSLPHPTWARRGLEGRDT